MKIIKKNQIVIYTLALIIMIAGFLNYKEDIKNTIQSSALLDANDDTKISDIGDATLVNSSDVIQNETNSVTNTNTNTIETSNNYNTSINTKEDEYFSKSKLERETMYSQIIESYEKILNSSSSLDTQKQIATEEIKKINDLKSKIMICENLIKTKGFDNNVVFVNDESVSVIIEADELSKEEVAQIQNIVSRELNKNVQNINITNKKKI